ncbi:MAG TPA: hypothetical protein G4O07_01215 [Dehalococcoidia bacterium]|nr:hypothetical protein [Dehalococcoidia bacterium]
MGLSQGKHGVIVIHGISDSEERGELLASVTNALADSLLESPAGQGGTTPVYPVVEREVDITSDPPSATLHIKAPDGKEATWVCKEAYWAKAFPAPLASSVLRWLWKQIGGQLRYAWRGFWRDPANNEDYRPEGRQATENPSWHSYRFTNSIYRIELFMAGMMLLPLSVIVPAVLFVIWPLYWMPRFDMLARFLDWLHMMDPFLSRSLGDIKRYIEHGVWSANARGKLESIVIDMLNDRFGEIEDITIVAHSMGAVVTYDALSEGGRIAHAIEQMNDSERPKKLTFISIGSGINQVFRMVEKSNLYARTRFKRPLAAQITGYQPGAHQDTAFLQQKFFWLDIYARFDPIPAGDLDDEIIRQAQVHESQVKRRRVINLDNPVRDHSYYWKNRALVIPRIARAINGGIEYPWPEAGITDEKVKRHIQGVASLVLLRLLMAVVAIGCLVMVVLNLTGTLALLSNTAWLFFILLAVGAYQAIRSYRFGDIS